MSTTGRSKFVSGRPKSGVHQFDGVIEGQRYFTRTHALHFGQHEDLALLDGEAVQKVLHQSRPLFAALLLLGGLGPAWRLHRRLPPLGPGAAPPVVRHHAAGDPVQPAGDGGSPVVLLQLSAGDDEDLVNEIFGGQIVRAETTHGPPDEPGVGAVDLREGGWLGHGVDHDVAMRCDGHAHRL